MSCKLWCIAILGVHYSVCPLGGTVLRFSDVNCACYYQCHHWEAVHHLYLHKQSPLFLISDKYLQTSSVTNTWPPFKELKNMILDQDFSGLFLNNSVSRSDSAFSSGPENLKMKFPFSFWQPKRCGWMFATGGLPNLWRSDRAATDYETLNKKQTNIQRPPLFFETFMHHTARTNWWMRILSLSVPDWLNKQQKYPEVG